VINGSKQIRRGRFRLTRVQRVIVIILLGISGLFAFAAVLLTWDAILAFRGELDVGRLSGSAAGWLCLVGAVVCALPFAICGAMLLADSRTRQPTPVGICADCGYDLRGSQESGVCPECGRPIDGAH